MGKAWDAFVPGPDVWAECLRVLKPGGYALVFAGTRTVDLMGISLRLGGFEIRDSILAWVYGSGFPKSYSLGRAVDDAHGAERAVIREATPPPPNFKSGVLNNRGPHSFGNGAVTIPSTDDGRRFEAYGTALKPAHEPIIVARKPLDGTHAHNALKWGTGGINVDGCRVASNGDHKRGVVNGAQTGRTVAYAASAHGGMSGDGFVATDHPAGRWPPNVVLSHAVGCRDECVQGCPVGELARQSGTTTSSGGFPLRSSYDDRHGWTPSIGKSTGGVGDTGTAARFFPTFDPPFQYVAKASRAEREAGCEHLDAHTRSDVTGRDEDSAGQNHPRAMSRRQGEIRNTHPTVKPARGLMTWLVRLVTPPNPDAVVLDPFCGSGSTGIACVIERVNFVGVELDEHHVEIARARIAHAITDAGLTAQDIEDTTTTDKDVVTPTGPAQVCLF